MQSHIISEIGYPKRHDIQMFALHCTMTRCNVNLLDLAGCNIGTRCVIKEEFLENNY